MPQAEGLAVYVNLVRKLREDRFFTHVPLRSLDGRSGVRKKTTAAHVEPEASVANNKGAQWNKNCLVRLESLDNNRCDLR